MTRHRARPSFTVEIKRTRNAPLPFTEDPDRKRAAQNLWKGTALADGPERTHVIEQAFAVATPGDAAPPRTAPAPAPQIFAKPVAKEPPPGPARRVLQSLIEAPAPEPVAEPEAAPRRDLAERLPKVRRVAPVRKPARAPEAAMPAAPIVSQTAVAPPPPAAPRPAAAAETRRPSRVVPKLRAGERWKRRLPRVCW